MPRGSFRSISRLTYGGRSPNSGAISPRVGVEAKGSSPRTGSHGDPPGGRGIKIVRETERAHSGSSKYWRNDGIDQLLASPHPLDFDWRFDARTTAKLCELVRARRVLALGVPSVARRIEASGGRVLLVDRQPMQHVRNHLVADVPTLDIHEGAFDIAIADAPWYPRELIDWVSAGARAIRPGGQVLASVWPPETRPTAGSDLARVMAELREWADVTELPIELAYEAPPFELVAMSISRNDPLARSPKHGRLVQLELRRRPQTPTCRAHPQLWHRFFLDGYQLAVRLRPTHAARNLIVPHPEAKGWLWPYVSARAPGRDRIGIWSSEGEVALVGDPKQLISVLQESLVARDRQAFETSLLATAPELIAWKIPHPPYQRVLEWQHP